MRGKQVDSDIILTRTNGKRVLIDAFSIAAVLEGIFARTVILKAGSNDNELKGRKIEVKEDLDTIHDWKREAQGLSLNK